MCTAISRPVVCAVLLGSFLTVASACAAAAPGGRVYVRVGPPAPIVEVRSVAPGPRHVWIDGHHRWIGGRYVWTPGQWTVPPRDRAVWVPGHWQRTNRGWFFVEGRWR